MEKFAIICLTLIMFGIQHLTNWAIRKVYEDSPFTTLFIVIMSSIITWICLYNLTLWMYPLI